MIWNNILLQYIFFMLINVWLSNLHDYEFIMIMHAILCSNEREILKKIEGLNIWIDFFIWMFQTSNFLVHKINWLDYSKEKKESKRKKKWKSKIKGEWEKKKKEKERKKDKFLFVPYLKRSILCNPSKFLMMWKFWNKISLDCKLENSWSENPQRANQ